MQLADGSLTEIREVVQGERILASNFSDLKIREAGCSFQSARSDFREAFEIDTGHKITASANHCFFKMDGMRIAEIEAKDIRKGDYLAHAKSIPVATSVQGIPEQNFKEVVVVNKQGAGMIRNLLKAEGYSTKTQLPFLQISPRQFRRVLNQGFPTASENISVLSSMAGGKTFSAQLLANVEAVETHKHKNLQSQDFFTKELAQITGYFLGDGHAEERCIRFKDARKEVLEEYAALFEKLYGINCGITPVSKKNCHQLNVNSKELAELFRHLKATGLDLAAKSPNNVLAQFIKGFFDAEGSVDKKIRRISFSQKDTKVLQKLQLLLKRFGINSRIRTCGKKRPNNLLELFSTDVVKFALSIGLTAPDKKALLEKWVKEFDERKSKTIVPIERNALKAALKKEFGFFSKALKPRPYRHTTVCELERVMACLNQKQTLSMEGMKTRQFIENILNNDVFFEKVRETRKVKNEKPLYDISVPGMENYIANGFIVHNSKTRLYLRKSKEDKRVAKLVDSPSLPDGEAVYRVTENGIEDV
ncbi:MAG: LAGLIDADG family homing endonuclease [Candidatus Diapherotrites archaeon]